MEQENHKFEYNPSVAYPEVGNNLPIGHPMGHASQNINSSPYSSNGINRGVVIAQGANPRPAFNYDFIRAEQNKNNWTTIIKVLSWALLIFGIFCLIFSVINLLGDLASMDDNYYDDVHYDYSFASVNPEFSGGIGAFLSIFEILQNIFMIVQGYYGIKTVKSEKPEAIRKLIKISIWLTLGHLVVIGIKILITSLILHELNQQWIWKNDDDFTSIGDFTELVFGILFVSMAFACFCTCCC